jgi:hypothetical protein
MGDENTIVEDSSFMAGRSYRTCYKTEAIEESERMMNVYADFAEDLWLSQL